MTETTDEKVARLKIAFQQASHDAVTKRIPQSEIEATLEAALRAELEAIAQPVQTAPAPGYCKTCKDYTIEEPLVAPATPQGKP